MSRSSARPEAPALFPGGASEGVSGWVSVTQEMIDGFACDTLDPDPMHVDPDWARSNGPYGGTIAFGFLTISLLTHLLRDAVDRPAGAEERGHYLNYGFDRLRLITPVRTGARVRGRFAIVADRTDDRGRHLRTIDAVVEIEGEPRPALAAHWLTIWVPAE